MTRDKIGIETTEVQMMGKASDEGKMGEPKI